VQVQNRPESRTSEPKESSIILEQPLYGRVTRDVVFQVHSTYLELSLSDIKRQVADDDLAVSRGNDRGRGGCIPGRARALLNSAGRCRGSDLGLDGCAAGWPASATAASAGFGATVGHDGVKGLVELARHVCWYGRDWCWWVSDREIDKWWLDVAPLSQSG